MLVVDKPAGITVHPGAGSSSRTLAAQLLDLGAQGGDDPERPGIVHRLDRDTSGLLVVARSERAFAGCFRPRYVEREVDGATSRSFAAGRARAPGGSTPRIGRDRATPRRRSLDTDEPREAATWFEVARARPSALFSTSGSRPGGRTRSASTWPRSTCRSSGDPTYGAKGDLGLGAPVPARAPAALSASGLAGRARPRVAASGRPRSGARPGSRRRQLDFPPVFVPSTRRPVVAGVPSPCARFRPARRRNHVQPTGKGLIACQSSRCESCWRPASTSATRRAAGTPRCAASSSASAAASTSSTSRRRRSCSRRRTSSSRNIAERGGTILFVGTKKQAQNAVEEHTSASACRT